MSAPPDDLQQRLSTAAPMLFLALRHVCAARDQSPKARIPANLEIAVNACRAAIAKVIGDKS
jgi:hypothetical protein